MVSLLSLSLAPPEDSWPQLLHHPQQLQVARNFEVVEAITAQVKPLWTYYVFCIGDSSLGDSSLGLKIINDNDKADSIKNELDTDLMRGIEWTAFYDYKGQKIATKIADWTIGTTKIFRSSSGGLPQLRESLARVVGSAEFDRGRSLLFVVWNFNDLVDHRWRYR